MTKRTANPVSRIAQMRVAAASKKPSTVNKIRVDARTAALVVKTYEALSPKNRKAFAQLPTAQMIAAAKKLQRKASLSGKFAKVQKKADAGNGVVYFGIIIWDDEIEHDMDSEDSEDRERYEDFVSGHEDATDAAYAAETAMFKQMAALFKKALGRNVTINDEGHNNYELVCKVSVNSLDEVRKVKDMVDRNDGGGGYIYSDTVPYTCAGSFQFVSWGDKKSPEQPIKFEDLDEWLEDQAEAAKTAKAKKPVRKAAAPTKVQKKASKLKWQDVGQKVWVAEDVELHPSM